MSYVVPLVQAVQLYNFQTGALIEMPNEIGEPAAWHPWRNVLVNNDIHFQGESFSVHIFRLELPAAEATDLSGQIVTNDGSPAWSPTGDWIAFARKPPGTAAGRQLWLMRPDGSQTRALTDDAQTNFGPPAWSPDGSQLLSQRFDITEPGGEPGIWLVDVDDGKLHPVAGVGFQPEWLP